MQRRIGSGYYNPIIQYVAEMSGCENRLFLILALCVSGRLIPLAESGRRRVRNQKKIEFRTPPRSTACAFCDRTPPRPTACAFCDRTSPRRPPSLSQPCGPIYDLFFFEGIPSIVLCNLSDNTKVRLYHCHLARSRLKSRIIYFNWRIHLQFSCIIDSFYAKVLT